MSEHYFVSADQAHLRIYRQRQDPGQREADLDQVQAMDFPMGRNNYTDREASMAGRFASSKHQAAAPGAPGNGPGASGVGRTGMGIDERLPMQREEERRRNRNIAEEIEVFFAGRPDATWDIAVPAGIQHAVVDQLSERVRRRLRRTIPKDLVNQPAADVRAHFVGA